MTETTIDLDWTAFDQARGTHPRQAAQQPVIPLSPAAQAQVKIIQKQAGLPQTGQLDPATISYVNQAYDTQVKKDMHGGGASGGSSDKSKKAAADKKKRSTDAATKKVAAKKVAAKKKAVSERKSAQSKLVAAKKKADSAKAKVERDRASAKKAADRAAHQKVQAAQSKHIADLSSQLKAIKQSFARAKAAKKASDATVISSAQSQIDNATSRAKPAARERLSALKSSISAADGKIDAQNTATINGSQAKIDAAREAQSRTNAKYTATQAKQQVKSASKSAAQDVHAAKQAKAEVARRRAKATHDNAITPGGRHGDASPLAKPGYKGGRKLTNQEREIAHALIRKGHSKRDAIRMARGLVNHAARTGRWARHGKASARVRAASIKSVAQRASFSNDWADTDLSELVAEFDSLNLAEHVPGTPYKYKHGWVERTPGLSKKADSPVAEHGMTHDASLDSLDSVKAALAADWSKAPIRSVPVDGAFARESHVQSKTVARVAADPSQIRANYEPHILLLKDGRRVVIDGHNRVAIRHALARRKMKARVMSESVDLAEHVPGTPYHYKHGWIPLNTGTHALDTNTGLTPQRETLRTSAVGKAVHEVRARRAAASVLAHIKEQEPGVTKDLTGIVAGLGGHMEALKATPDTPGDFRFKKLDSMTRKIADKSAAKGLTEDQYAAKIGDALRYTAVFKRKSYVSKSHELLAEFTERGYTVESVENTFAHGQAYSGVNVNLINPKGARFELQLHTPESIAAKHQIHGHYEVYRKPATSEADKIKAYNAMLAVNNALARPPGYETLGQQIQRANNEHFDRSQRRLATKKLRAQGLAAKLRNTTFPGPLVD